MFLLSRTSPIYNNNNIEMSSSENIHVMHVQNRKFSCEYIEKLRLNFLSFYKSSIIAMATTYHGTLTAWQGSGTTFLWGPTYNV